MSKKKILLQILLLFLLLTGCTASPNELIESDQLVSEATISTVITSESEHSDSIETTMSETSTEKTEMIIPDEYYTVIDSIVEFVENYDHNDVSTTVGNEYSGGVWELCSYDNAKDLIGYAFVDIDDDNTAELAIIDLYTTGNRIIDLYTYIDGEVKHLLSGGFRARIYLTNQMYIIQEGTSGVGYSTSIKSILECKTHELLFVEAYFTRPVNYEMPFEEIALYHTTDKSTINSEDIDLSSAEIICTYTEQFDFYGEYGVQKEVLYVFGEITTLTDYLDN